MTTVTKEQIIELLAKSDKAVGRALVVLHERQTAAEQSSESTHVHNGRGFQPAHAKPGSGMAKFYMRAGFLTPKQVAFWRKPNKHGQMRIARYWKQLLEAVAEKQAAQPVAVVGMLSSSEVKNFDNASKRFERVTHHSVFEPFSASGGDR